MVSGVRRVHQSCPAQPSRRACGRSTSHQEAAAEGPPVDRTPIEDTWLRWTAGNPRAAEDEGRRHIASGRVLDYSGRADR